MKKDYSSYGLNTLGPLCLWQCFSIVSQMASFTATQLGLCQWTLPTTRLTLVLHYLFVFLLLCLYVIGCCHFPNGKLHRDSIGQLSMSWTFYWLKLILPTLYVCFVCFQLFLYTEAQDICLFCLFPIISLYQGSGYLFVFVCFQLFPNIRAHSSSIGQLPMNSTYCLLLPPALAADFLIKFFSYRWFFIYIYIYKGFYHLH